MTHDYQVPYVEEDLGEVAGGFTQTVGKRSIVVAGQCPRCHGDTKTEYPLGLPGTKGVFSRKPRPVDMLGVEVLFCECRYSHPHLPADPVFVGCGAQWRVRS